MAQKLPDNLTPEQKGLLLGAAADKLSPVEFGRSLGEKGLMPADATKLMDIYRRVYPKFFEGIPKPGLPAAKVAVECDKTGPVVAISREPSTINRSAVKKYALKVSKLRRAGKFKRVGEDFFIALEAYLESCFKAVGTPDVPADPGAEIFVTGKAVQRARTCLNTQVQEWVFGRVSRHPSTGVTLK